MAQDYSLLRATLRCNALQLVILDLRIIRNTLERFVKLDPNQLKGSYARDKSLKGTGIVEIVKDELGK